MRSAQFGVYDSVLSILRKNHESSNVLPVKRILGVFDPHIIIAGFAGTLMPVHFIFSLALHQSSFHCSSIVSACLPFFFFCVSSLNSFNPVSLLYLTSSLVCYLLFTAFVYLLYSPLLLSSLCHLFHFLFYSGFFSVPRLHYEWVTQDSHND